MRAVTGLADSAGVRLARIGRPRGRETFLDEEKLAVAATKSIADADSDRARDPNSVDEGTVAAGKVAQRPASSIGCEFGMAPADRRIGQIKRLGGASHELRLTLCKREYAASIGSSHNNERQHRRILCHGDLPCAPPEPNPMAEPLTASMRIVILHGKDSFLIVERLRRFHAALNEQFGEVSRFDLDGATVRTVDLLDELRTFGLLAAHKFVVVDKAEQFVANEDARRALERYAQSPMQEATLVLRADSWRPGNLDKMVSAVGAVLKCDPPSIDDAKRWCGARAQKHYSLPIDADAADALVERVGNDLARLDSELAKFAAYLATEPEPKRRVTKALVTALTGQTREEAAWEIQEALLAGNPAAAIRKVRELIEISQAPEQLLIWSIVDLSRKLHDAARLLGEGTAEGVVAKQVKLWGPSQAPTIRAAKTLGSTRAAQLFREAIDLDRRSKSGLAGELPRTLEAFAMGMSTMLAVGNSRR